MKQAADTSANQAGTAGEKTSPASAKAAPSGSAWSPLSHPVFRMVWIATVASNIGTWMHDVGASWMMTSLNPDPLMIAMVQAAGSLPMFLFALPSGVLADIVDRRKYMLFAQVWMLVTAAALGVLAFGGLVTPGVLLGTTFLLSMGAAMSAPAFQAIVPDLVPKSDLPQAVALNSLGINISRAIGPALGGLILSFAGPPAVFMLNAVSVVGVMYALYRWKPAEKKKRLPPEHFIPAIRTGVRYVRSAPVLRIVLARSVAFFLFGSAGWALLPLVARQELGVGPGGYGLLLTSIGIGAVAGALLLPKIRAALGADKLVVVSSLIFAMTMLAQAYVRHFWLLAGMLLFAGFSWIAVLSTLNVGAQRSTANWVKARALAAYLTVFFGSMTAGSAIWGQIASLLGVTTSFVIAAAGMAVASAAGLRWRLDTSPALDLSPAELVSLSSTDTDHDRGPVMISVEYDIDPAEAGPFTNAARELERVRKRSGALSWALYEDKENPRCYVEVFIVESWLEHLRQHERHTANDQAIRTRVHAFHRGPAAPVIRHLIAPNAAS
jgi:MFS family permease